MDLLKRCKMSQLSLKIIKLEYMSNHLQERIRETWISPEIYLYLGILKIGKVSIHQFKE